MSGLAIQTGAGMTAQAALFWLFALSAGGSAIGVALSRNIVRMAVMLLFTLAGVAGLYLTLDAEFLAAVQLVVYVGGTLILIVFGVMLTSKLPSLRLMPSKREVAIAAVLGAVLLAALVVGLRRSMPALVANAQPTSTAGDYPMRELGQALLGDYLVPFEVASVLLLVVMIGAAYLAKGRRKVDSQ